LPALGGAAGDAEGVEGGLEAVFLEEVEDLEAGLDVPGSASQDGPKAGDPREPPDAVADAADSQGASPVSRGR
jgi:hypothetical protein